MGSELIAWLGETTLATSAAVMLVLVLRRTMRAAFGSGAAYGLWLLVPVALVAVSLPAPVRPLAAMPSMVTLGAMQAMVPAPRHATLPWTQLLAMAWGLGMLVAFALQAWQQWHFVRRLGPLRRTAHGLRVANACAGLPAVTGVLRPRIVLPADFLKRYDADERALVVAHERAHIARGDLPCNALVALLRCVYWFNPLLHWAVARYRHDQELACDARVLRRHPQARRAYAQAMLKTQLDDFALPVGCHWHTHPIKERIAMLKRPSPRRWQTGLSSALLLALCAGGGYAAWAQQPAASATDGAYAVSAAQYELKLDTSFDGERHGSALRGVSKKPQSFQVKTDAGNTWDVEVTPEPYGEDLVKLSMVIRRNGAQLDTPMLITRPGVPASIRQQPGAGQPGAASYLISVDVHVSGASVNKRAAQHPQAAPPPAAMAHDTARQPDQAASAVAFSQQPPPSYPKEAANNRIGGHVVMLVDVRADGTVRDAQVVESVPAGVFDAASLEAVRKWRFNPAIKDGKQVAGRVRVPIDFSIDEPQPQGGAASSQQRPRGPARGRQVLADVASDGTASNVRLDTARKATALEREAMRAVAAANLKWALEKQGVASGTVAFETRPAPAGFLAGR